MDDLDPVDLEEKQRLRLLTAFHNILTYDDRDHKAAILDARR